MVGRIKQYFRKKRSEKTFKLWISLNKGTILKLAEPEHGYAEKYFSKLQKR